MSNDASALKKSIAELLRSDQFTFQRFIDLSGELSRLDKDNLRFTVDANALINLGRDSIKDEATAIIELVKNGYDADALKVEIDIITQGETKYIRIADNGSGMTRAQVLENWLRIGFSDKKFNKISEKKRRKTGEKGIGRLSADRLGSSLTLVTKSKQDGLFGLSIDWEEFNKPNRNLHAIPLSIVEHPSIKIPESNDHSNDTGTELIINYPRHAWNDVDVQNLYNQLSLLTNPDKATADFEIFLNTDIKTTAKGKVIPQFFKSSEVSIYLDYDGKDFISYKLTDKHGFSYKESRTGSWKELINYVQDVRKVPVKESLTCGPVILELQFFLDEAPTTTDSNFKLKDLRAFLKENNGVRIYRDDISVKPYGYAGLQGSDWLDLGERQGRDPAGIDRESWKVKPYQILGTILISRDTNAQLIDSAAREGLVQNDAFYDLRALTLASIRLIEVHRYKIYQSFDRGSRKQGKANKILDAYKEEILKLKEELAELKQEAENNSVLRRAADQVAVVINKTDETEKTIAEILNKNRTLAGLATIGISSAVFGHETQISLSNLITTITNAKLYLEVNPPNPGMALNRLTEALSYADLVAEWGAFSLTRIRRDKRKRENVSIKTVIDKVIEDLLPNFKAVDISIEKDIADLHDRTFQMDVETILINLLTNAYSACLQVNERARSIMVRCMEEEHESKIGYSIVVADSGYGVMEDLRDIIWEPLFSTKLTKDGKEGGTGLGLSIVKSVVDDMDGFYHVSEDENLGGASFKIWLPYNFRKND